MRVRARVLVRFRAIVTLTLTLTLIGRAIDLSYGRPPHRRRPSLPSRVEHGENQG